VPDVKAEIRQLNRRANEMHGASSWSEAADLAEASLLLDPEQVVIHHLASDAILRHARRLWDTEAGQGRPPGTTRDDFANSLAKKHAGWYHRGTPHLEYYLTHARISMGTDYRLVSGYLEWHPDEKSMREMMLRVLKENLRRKQPQGGNLFVNHCQQWCFKESSAAERLAWNLEAARHWPDSRKGSVYSLLTYRRELKTAQEWREIAAALEDAPSASARDLADWIQQQLARGANPADASPDYSRIVNTVKKEPPPSPQPPPPPTETDVKFEPTPFPRKVTGYLDGGPGIDITWTQILERPNSGGRREGDVPYHRGTVRVLPGENPAEHRTVAEVVVNHFGNPVCYDGRYIWGFQNSKERFPGAEDTTVAPTPRILVVDPRTSQHWFILPRHGVPPMPVRGFTVAPLGVGTVCAVGIVGPDELERAWIARVSLDTTGSDHDVKVFHEAREQTPGGGTEEGDPQAAFSFGIACSISEERTEDEEPRRRVIVDRRTKWPLIVDPETLSVRVGRGFTYPIYPCRYTPHEGALYWIGRTGHDKHVWRYGFPELKPQQSEHKVPDGILVFSNNRACVLSTAGEF
jgi:hypothetical protein